MLPTSGSLRRLLPLVCAIAAGGCDKAVEKATGPGAGPLAPVRLASAERRDLPLDIRTIGAVESLAVVTIRPQIAGRIVETPFVEGGDVSRDDVLVRLDARPFEAALHESEARLEASKAREFDANLALAQMESAMQGRAVSERERDKSKADALAAAAEVRMNEAAVETARLQLEYCTIRAPIAGRTGLVKVKAGNVVKENETEIVQVSQIDPIGVSFAVPEQHLAEIRRLQKLGPLVVEAAPPGDDGPPERGEVSFSDSQVDPATGTLRMRATVANPDRRLWPGQFVRVTLRMTVEKDVIVVPAHAVQTGQKGQFVFVVKDGTAHMVDVTVSRTSDGLAAIASGLNAGDQIVTEGQLRLLPGTRVQAKAEPGAGA